MKKKKQKKRNVTASDIFTNLSDLMTMPVGMSVETWLLIINLKGKFKVTFFLMVQKNLLPKYTMDCGNNKAMNSVLATNYMLNGTQTIFCYLDNYRRFIILFTDISKVTFLTLRTLSIEIQNFTFFFHAKVSNSSYTWMVYIPGHRFHQRSFQTWYNPKN